ncbi:uncharacterized protein LOC129566086 [Sitodiplosis mosellana]|uniref:uncharacterized protein LOC129566086 n=1 Tax=Sitodiplosis mosellana TaxID=263140 RepID=UPI00244468DC|nr:uncharacterized protein LOC129566086 [Sitodiplosis mosellana]
MDIFDDAIYIYREFLAVQLIRRFGQSVSRIHLKLKTKKVIFLKSVRDQRDIQIGSLRENLFLHVNEYCHKTLNDLLIWRHNDLLIWGDSHRVHALTFGAVKHPFENVEKFSFHKGTVGAGFEHFNRLFPRLRQLEVVDSFSIPDWKHIAHTFPNLNAFTFNNDSGFPKYFTDSYLKTFITLNPQLESTELIGYYEPSIWEFVNAELKNLRSIYASYSPPHAQHFKDGPIQFNTVETFDVLSEKGTDKHSIDIFSFKRLKNMRVSCYKDQLEVWLDFILAHPTVEYLSIRIIDGWKMRDILDEFGKVRQKLIKVRQNTKFISLRLRDSFFYPSDIKNPTKFSELYQWFDKIFVNFDRRFPRMEEFCTIMPQFKKCKMTKNVLAEYTRVNFEECE